MAVIDKHVELQRSMNIRAGVIAAATYNAGRGRGQRLVKPTDFFRDPIREEDFLDPEAAAAMMDSWAAAENARR